MHRRLRERTPRPAPARFRPDPGHLHACRAFPVRWSWHAGWLRRRSHRRSGVPRAFRRTSRRVRGRAVRLASREARMLVEAGTGLRRACRQVRQAVFPPCMETGDEGAVRDAACPLAFHSSPPHRHIRGGRHGVDGNRHRGSALSPLDSPRADARRRRQRSCGLRGVPPHAFKHPDRPRVGRTCRRENTRDDNDGAAWGGE